MRVYVDSDLYSISEVCDRTLTEAQETTLLLLKEAAKRSQRVFAKDLVSALGLRSRLPLDSRLKHLRQKGAIELLLKFKPCPICLLSGRVSLTCMVCEGAGRIAVVPHDNCPACGDPIPVGDEWCDHHRSASTINEDSD